MRFLHGFWSWLGYWSGVTNESGKGYGFWSGIGSCLTYLGIITAGLRHVNCHTKGCWRVGKHNVDGTPFKTCRKHHPAISDKDITIQQITECYMKILEEKRKEN